MSDQKRPNPLADAFARAAKRQRTKDISGIVDDAGVDPQTDSSMIDLNSTVSRADLDSSHGEPANIDLLSIVSSVNDSAGSCVSPLNAESTFDMNVSLFFSVLVIILRL